MKKKQKIQLTEDLSYIDNLDDLDSKIRATKLALRIDERLLLEGFKEIPSEAIKSTVGNVVPFFAKTVAAKKTWNIVQTLASLLLQNPGKQGLKGIFAKDNLQQTAKQMGIFIGLNIVKSFLAKRKSKA